jgi:hypothetical protein
LKTVNAHNEALHFLARRDVAKWANCHADPERIVLHRDPVAATLSEKDRHNLVEQIRDIASALWLAFQSQDEYERDWFLTWARCLNAQYCVDAVIPRMPGGIPMAQESAMERAIFYVQKYIAHTMRLCPECETCFFQRKPKQKLCKEKCRRESKRKSNQISWRKNGSRWRTLK